MKNYSLNHVFSLAEDNGWILKLLTSKGVIINSNNPSIGCIEAYKLTSIDNPKLIVLIASFKELLSFLESKNSN